MMGSEPTATLPQRSARPATRFARPSSRRPQPSRCRRGVRLPLSKPSLSPNPFDCSSIHQADPNECASNLTVALSKVTTGMSILGGWSTTCLSCCNWTVTFTVASRLIASQCDGRPRLRPEVLIALQRARHFGAQRIGREVEVYRPRLATLTERARDCLVELWQHQRRLAHRTRVARDGPHHVGMDEILQRA